MSFKKIQKKVGALANERDENCRPIAEEILRIIGEAKLPMGDISEAGGLMSKDAEAKYAKVAEDILNVFLREDIDWHDREYVFKMALQAFENTRVKVTTSLEETYRAATSKLFGKDILNIKMSDVNKVFLVKE